MDPRLFLTACTLSGGGPGSAVGIATGYGLDGPGIESWRGGWGQIFRTCPDRPWCPPSLQYKGYRVFPGVKSGRGVTLTHHLLLMLWLRKSRAIPLLPLWAVRTVQSFRFCTRVHFHFYTIWLGRRYVWLTRSSTTLFPLYCIEKAWY